MATLEKNGILCTKDADGNLVLFYPATRLENVDGAAEAIAVKAAKPAVTVSTLQAGKWSNGQYSFEATYPNARFDVEVEPDSTCTLDQLEAWQAARMVGSATENIIKAYGDIPAVDIPIILKVVEK